MPDWDPDVVVDEALVGALLTEQFPELDASSARLLGEGWDNSVWIVEECWAFRFPHREIAVPGVERELAVLPLLAPRLPAPIPVPTFVGRPSDRFSRPFFGAPLLSGLEAVDVVLADADRIALGVDLGRFLRALHDVELDVDLPVDPIRRADMPFRVTRTRERVAEVSAIWAAPPAVAGILEAADSLPASTQRVVTHGDLHLRHVLVERRNTGRCHRLGRRLPLGPRDRPDARVGAPAPRRA